ncbi:MAG: hypothetical protein ACM3XO_15240 [Bacteroidota bacterium]
MKNTKFALPFFLLTLLLTSLACTLSVGGPDYSSLPPVPVSTEYAQSIQDEVQRAFQDAAKTGTITLNLNEEQLTSYVASRLQTDPRLQRNGQPLITDPQVYLRDGQMKIYGKTQQGIFTANIGIIMDVGVDQNGQPKVDIASADFGPLPAPEGLRDTVAAMIREAYMGSLGPVATGLRIESINIADGVMTINGRVK